ncbi:hypothetical protein [Flagellimonas onchidii]|uniref:hypothetical protein n=1 Tax=Flagellimonas onchidii TaxID=2562684 RepID=UPI0010A64DB5|nr:hypothetical protein [Allomuricauda onchidii]
MERIGMAIAVLMAIGGIILTANLGWRGWWSVLIYIIVGISGEVSAFLAAENVGNRYRPGAGIVTAVIAIVFTME